MQVCMLLMPTMMWADKEAWVEYADGTLTFHYDENRENSTSATYNLPASGEKPGWLEHKDDITKAVFDENFKDARPVRCSRWFYSQSKLTEIEGIQYLNTDSVNDMSYMFAFSSSLKAIDLSHFNTENVTTMTNMFADCTLTSLDVSSFNTEKVDDMSYMFYNCNRLITLDLSNFNTAKVTNMDDMFAHCKSLTAIYVTELFVAGQVKSSTYMFLFCESLPNYQSGYTDKSNAPEYLTCVRVQPWVEYQDATKTLTFHYNDRKKKVSATGTYDLPAENVTPGWLRYNEEISKVVFDDSFAQVRPVRCTKWFYGMQNLTNITGFEYLCTDSVDDMSYMFYDCDLLTSLDMRNFNTGSVTTMKEMFNGCVSLTELDLSSFCTQKVDNMYGMFWNCKKLTTLNLTSFDTQNVADMEYMFSNCPALSHIYVSSSFVVEQVKSSSSMFSKSTSLPNFDVNSSTDKSKAGEYLTYLSRQPWVEYQDSTQTLTFHYDTNQDLVTATAKYNLPSSGEDPGWLSCDIAHVVFLSDFADARPERCAKWFCGSNNHAGITDIIGLEYLCTDSVCDMSEMFAYCVSLTSLDLSNFNTANVTTMRRMFYDCCLLTKLDLSSFNTENVDDMSDMFAECRLLEELNLSSFNAKNVTTMRSMFYDCYSLTTPDFSSFNTEKLIDMSYMFFECNQLRELDLSSFNTANVTTARCMFYNCDLLAEINLSSFNTENVTDMLSMFEGCSSLRELDLSSFNTKKVEKMSYMFCVYNGTSMLEKIYVSEQFVTDKVSIDNQMFNNCTALPNFDSGSIGKEKAHYREGGYLTLRRHFTVGDTQYSVDGYIAPTCYTDVDFTDGATYSSTFDFTFDKGNTASYTRPVKNHWATLSLPFAFCTDDNTAKFYGVESYTDGNITVKQLSGTVAAGTPVLAYVTDYELSVSAMGAATVHEPASDSVLKGVFAQTEVADDDYIIANDHFWNAGWLKQKNDAQYVYAAPYRASLALNLSPSEAKPSTVSIAEDETDGIDSIGTMADEEKLFEGAELFDLQGRRLSVPVRGMMIVRRGGVSRKMVVK